MLKRLSKKVYSSESETIQDEIAPTKNKRKSLVLMATQVFHKKPLNVKQLQKQLAVNPNVVDLTEKHIGDEGLEQLGMLDWKMFICFQSEY